MIMLESSPEFRRRPERSRELERMIERPEQVFDSDLGLASQESKQVIQRLLSKAPFQYESPECDVEVTTAQLSDIKVPIIQFAWMNPNGTAAALLLEPSKSSVEPGLVFEGRFGTASWKRQSWILDKSRDLELDTLYGIPERRHVTIAPTISRWAIEYDQPANSHTNERRMYMGIGFLLLGIQWMHIGMHEAGHLPDEPNENFAWRSGNTHFAQLHEGQDYRGLRKHNRTTRGLFNLLLPPDRFVAQPTIGDIMRYGLTSHSEAGNPDASIPGQWNTKSNTSLRELRSTIERAHREFENLVS